MGGAHSSCCMYDVTDRTMKEINLLTQQISPARYYSTLFSGIKPYRCTLSYGGSEGRVSAVGEYHARADGQTGGEEEGGRPRAGKVSGEDYSEA